MTAAVTGRSARRQLRALAGRFDPASLVVRPAARSPTPGAAVSRWKRMRAQLAGAGCWKGDVLAVAAQPGGGYYAHPVAVGADPHDPRNPGLLAAWGCDLLPPGLVVTMAVL